MKKVSYENVFYKVVVDKIKQIILTRSLTNKDKVGLTKDVIDSYLSLYPIEELEDKIEVI